MWFRTKLREEEKVATEVRKSLGVVEPTIDLNTCALDELRRIPKLTLENQQDLIRLRQAHEQGIRNWTDVRRIRGVGPSIMVQLFVYCKDPATTPLEAVQPNNDGMSPGDVMALLEMPNGGASSGIDPELPGLISSSSSNASNSDKKISPSMWCHTAHGGCDSRPAVKQVA